MDNSSKDAIPDPLKKFSENIPPLSQITDRFGNTVFYGNAGQYMFLPFPIGKDNDYRTHVKQISEMEIRDDDIMICSFPKTGLHWHIEIVKMLMDNTANMANNVEERTCFLDHQRVENFKTRDSPRLLLTHVPFRHIPKQALDKKIKIIYLDRNPKDVFVSWYNHLHDSVYPFNYPGTFEHFFYFCLEVGYYYGDLFDYLMEWQEGIAANPDVPIFTSVYEDLKLDPIGGVKKLNQFLSTGCSDELCEQIAAACSFKTMKEFKNRTAAPMFKALSKKGELVFYRKGDVGDWKNWFTVTMNEEFDREYNKRMANYKTAYKYTL